MTEQLPLNLATKRGRIPNNSSLELRRNLDKLPICGVYIYNGSLSLKQLQVNIMVWKRRGKLGHAYYKTFVYDSRLYFVRVK